MIRAGCCRLVGRGLFVLSEPVAYQSDFVREGLVADHIVVPIFGCDGEKVSGRRIVRRAGEPIFSLVEAHICGAHSSIPSAFAMTSSSNFTSSILVSTMFSAPTPVPLLLKARSENRRVGKELVST